MLPPLVAQALVTLVGIAVVVWAARRGSESVSFAVAVSVSVLIAPALYPHYLAILVLPMLLALRFAPRPGGSGWSGCPPWAAAPRCSATWPGSRTGSFRSWAPCSWSSVSRGSGASVESASMPLASP